MVANRNVPIVAKLLKQHVLGLHGKRKGTIVAKFEKSHLWVILHAHMGLFPKRDIFSNEFRTCYHVAFVGSAQYSILQCLAQAKSFFVKYAAYHKQCMQVVMGCECVGQGEANADKLDCCTCLELQVRCWLRRDTLHSSLLVGGASCSSEIALIQLLPLIWQCIS